MTKTKTATIKLVSSIFSLFACVALFFGMTFAWFTDSVTSGKNKIQAGNLDIKFEYSKTLEEDSWKEVTNNTQDLFKDQSGNDILWEPGAANIVYLKIKNAGTLALKYNLGINVVSEIAGTNIDNAPFKLSDYIQFGQVEMQEGDAAYTDRNTAIQALSNSKKVSDGYTIENIMTSGTEKIIALVVYMPEDVGNEANYKTGTNPPEINMGITLLATQTSHESDSFNKNYDTSAAYNVVTSTVIAGENTVLKLGTIAEIVIPSNATAGNNALVDGEKLTLSVEPTDNVPSGYTITSGAGTTTYDITIVNEDGQKITDENGAIQVKFYVGPTGATEVKHIVNGVAEDVPFTVDGDYIIFSTKSFSPYVIKSKYVAMIGNKKYEDLQVALNDAKNGETITLLSDIFYDNCNTAPLKYLAQNENITATLDLNGKTVLAKLNNQQNISLLKVGSVNADKHKGTASITIEDSSNDMTGTLTVEPTTASSSWTVTVSTIMVERLGRLTFNKGNVITDAKSSNAETPYGIDVLTNTGAQTAELTVNGGYIESKSPTGMGVRIGGNSTTGTAKFTMNGGTIVGSADGRGVWLHHFDDDTLQLIECTINGGTIKADRALEVGDFNKDTEKNNNIKIELNGGEFISTNTKNFPSHPTSEGVFLSYNPKYYNPTFAHVELTDNR